MWLSRVFRPPALSDPDARRVARALAPVGWTFIAAAAGTVAIAWLVEIPNASPGTCLAALAAGVLSLSLSQLGRPAVGAALLIALSWLFLASRAWEVGQVGPELGGALMVVVLGAGCLLGPGGALFVAAVSAIVPAAVLALGSSAAVGEPEWAARVARSGVTSMMILAGGALARLAAVYLRRAESDSSREASARLERERELHESEERYRALLERLPPRLRRAGEPVFVESNRHGSDAGGTILVVDDDPTVRRVARRMLELSGWRVLEADGGRAAVSRLEADRDEIGCVVLDRVMPDMDGERTFRALRALRPDLPIMLVSGQPDPALSQRLSDQPRLAFVDKPFRLAELERHLRRIGCCS